MKRTCYYCVHWQEVEELNPPWDPIHYRRGICKNEASEYHAGLTWQSMAICECAEVIDENHIRDAESGQPE